MPQTQQQEQHENPEVFPRRTSDSSVYLLLVGIVAIVFLFLTLLDTDKPSTETTNRIFQREEQPAELPTATSLDIGVIPEDETAAGR